VMSGDDVVVPGEHGDEWWWVMMTMLCQVSMVMSGDDVVVPGEHGDEWWLCCCARWVWWWVMMTMLCQVSMVMHGEYGMSETRELVSQDGQPLFERNSRDTFYITSVTLPASSVYCRSGNCDTSISLYVLIFWHFFVCVVIQIPYLFFFIFKYCFIYYLSCSTVLFSLQSQFHAAVWYLFDLMHILLWQPQ